MHDYGFDDKIINHSFTDLIIESDNLELFKLYILNMINHQSHPYQLDTVLLKS